MTEMKSLPFVALLILQELELRLRFHALGNDPLLEVFAHPDDHTYPEWRRPLSQAITL
jgi:hypothetical protein